MDKSLTRVRVLVCLGLSIFTFFFFGVNAAFAHIPHDVILDTQLSPNYANDRTVYHLVHSGFNTWGNVFKSEDRGQSWQRIENGLDNQYRLSSLAIAAQSPDTLYLSSLGDGIYKSINCGQDWLKVNQGIQNLNIKRVFISPHSPTQVMAMGTEGGLYRTEDGGQNWSSVVGERRQVTALAYLPNQDARILVGDSQGRLYLSDDRGDNWQLLSSWKDSGSISEIVISPNFESDRTFFVGTEKTGVFKTSDGGQSFKSINQGLSDRSIVAVALSPNYPTDATLLVSTGSGGIFQSNNGGVSWQKSDRGLITVAQATVWKRPHFPRISLSPNFAKDRTIFIAGFAGLFKSVDGGRHWQDSNVGLARADSIHQLAVSPNFAHDKTLAISTLFNAPYLSHDRGKTWTVSERGIQLDKMLKQHLLSNVLSLAFSPNYRFDRTLLASAWGCFFKSTDGGKHWNKYWLPESLKADSYLTVSPNFKSDRTIYLSTSEAFVLRSTDGGEHFSIVAQMGEKPIRLPSLAISPNFAVDRTLYLGGYAGGIRKSVDGGLSWRSVANNPQIEGAGIELVVFSPNYQADRTVFAATTRGLFVTYDDGLKWEKLGSAVDGEESNIEHLAISPNYVSDRSFLINVKGKGLFKTTDAGQSFSRITQTPAILAEFSPAYAADRTIYAAIDTTLLRSTDGGQSWQTLPLQLRDYNWLSILRLIVTNAPERKIGFTLILALSGYWLLRLFKWGRKRKMLFTKRSNRVVLP